MLICSERAGIYPLWEITMLSINDLEVAGGGRITPKSYKFELVKKVWEKSLMFYFKFICAVQRSQKRKSGRVKIKVFIYFAKYEKVWRTKTPLISEESVSMANFTRLSSLTKVYEFWWNAMKIECTPISLLYVLQFCTLRGTSEGYDWCLTS